MAPLAPMAPMAQEDFLSDLEKTLRDAYKTSIQPNLVAVTTSCATFKKQMPMMLGWSRTVQLMGQSGFATEVAKIFDALEKGTANCYNEAFTKCVVQHDLPQVTAMFSYLRQLQLLGAADLVDESRIDKCVRFDLNFESDLSYQSTLPNPIGVQVGLRMKLRAKVPLRFDGNFKVTGSAPLEWLSASWTGILPPDVSVNHVGPGSGSTLNVVSLATDLNLYEGPPPPPQIELTYDSGAPTVLNSYLFGDPPTPVFFPDFEWRSPYYFLHSDEAIFGLEGPLVARDWHFSGFWARKTYQRARSVPGVLNASENTFMELIHTPVQ